MKNHHPLHPRINPNNEHGHEQKQRRQEEEEKEEEEPRCGWDLSLSAVLSSSSPSVAASDVIGAIEFDPTDKIIATGGISRKIRFYGLDSLSHKISGDGDAAACEYYICTPAKLSSLRWRPRSDGRVIGSGDYDGVVTEYDLEKRSPVFERDEHGGRRVWSVDYTRLAGASVVGASGSDDGTVHVWDPRSRPENSIAIVRPGRSSAVCCVEFEPSGGATIAVGCADRRGYVYDVRKLVEPALTLEGHAKTVSYVRFLDVHTVVTAGTDGCLKLWKIDGGGGRVGRTYEGHVNSRNFVGLSVWRNGGLFGCGSENNRVFVYDRRWSRPVWVHEFEPAGMTGLEQRFVSSVCWRQSGVDQCTLVAGGSDGVLQVYVGKRKPYYI
ncbi:PREDICTED: WD repeat-containing protein RUP2 [Tarenaya hassleriana]|uniref:WD repeat-containing protein RUP2 n=1 Tax=Tarenaya hassleriana TaxID=28532 RepID=UPI00053C362F|nr:PREDICTED: WD repeat-containing protein RUP2 [Tarenaya hassleriana]